LFIYIIIHYFWFVLCCILIIIWSHWRARMRFCCPEIKFNQMDDCPCMSNILGELVLLPGRRWKSSTNYLLRPKVNLFLLNITLFRD
jgi:hypothetical protein